MTFFLARDRRKMIKSILIKNSEFFHWFVFVWFGLCFHFFPLLYYKSSCIFNFPKSLFCRLKIKLSFQRLICFFLLKVSGNFNTLSRPPKGIWAYGLILWRNSFFSPHGAEDDKNFWTLYLPWPYGLHRWMLINFQRA